MKTEYQGKLFALINDTLFMFDGSFDNWRSLKHSEAYTRWNLTSISEHPSIVFSEWIDEFYDDIETELQLAGLIN